MWYEDCELVVISMLILRLVRKLGFVGFEEFGYAVVVDVLRGIDKPFLNFRVLGLVPKKQL